MATNISQLKGRGWAGIIGKTSQPLVSLAVMVLLAGSWAGILLDQMPCFLGVPNCD